MVLSHKAADLGLNSSGSSMISSYPKRAQCAFRSWKSGYPYRDRAEDGFAGFRIRTSHVVSNAFDFACLAGENTGSEIAHKAGVSKTDGTVVPARFKGKFDCITRYPNQPASGSPASNQPRGSLLQFGLGTVAADVLGNVFFEFSPDIQAKLHLNRVRKALHLPERNPLR